MAGGPTVSCIDPVSDPQWGLLLGHRNASVFHSPPWILALKDTYGLDVRACVLNESQRGGLAFCEIDDDAGRRIVSLPFSDACDPLADAPELLRPIIASLKSRQVPVYLRCLGNESGVEGFTTTKVARWHSLDLSSPVERIWSRFDPSTRRAIRKAQRTGVEIRPLASNEDVDAFHRIHVRLRRCKYRMLAQPAAFFHAIARRFQEVGGWFSAGAFLEGKLIAATVYLRWGNTLYYKFNASDPAALGSRPNNLLVWEGVRLARSLGCERLDFGPSDEDQPGLIRFKRDFGACEREVRFLNWTPEGWDGSRAELFRRSLGRLAHRATEPGVTDEECARAGAELYRFFA
jgi:hypothetical protein